MAPLVTLLLTVGATLGSVALVLVLALAVRRRGARERARAEADRRDRSRADEHIARLDAKVAELSADVARERSAAARREAAGHDYVITTLLDPERPAATDTATGPARRPAPVAPTAAVAVPDPGSGALTRTARTAGPAQLLASAVETRVVTALARQQGVSALRDRAVDLGVQGVALAHGVRRALSPDSLDRAAAEAHVARRRSRRLRRAEVREARRLVRHLRAGDGRPVTVRAAGSRDVA